MSSSINQSYFYKAEELYGWNDSYYFTFFAEFQREYPSIAAVDVFFLLLLFVAAFAGNLTIICVVARYKDMQTVTNYFLCNLAASSLLYTLGGPFIAVIRITETWVLGEFMCHMLIYIEFVGGFAAIWTMTFISIDRFRRTVQYAKRRLSKPVCIGMVVTLWIICLAGFWPIAKYFVLVDFPLGDTNVTVCTLIWPRRKNIRISYLFTSLVGVFGYFIPLVTMGHNYFRILRKLFASKRSLANHRHHQGGGENSVNVRASTGSVLEELRRDQRAYRVVRVMLMLVLLFLITWTPVFICFGVTVLEASTGKTKFRSSYFMIAMALIYVNAVVNPVLYCLSNGMLKKHIVDDLSKLLWFIRKCSCCFGRWSSVGTQDDSTSKQTETPPIEMSSFSKFA